MDKNEIKFFVGVLIALMSLTGLWYLFRAQVPIVLDTTAISAEPTASPTASSPPEKPVVTPLPGPRWVSDLGTHVGHWGALDIEARPKGALYTWYIVVDEQPTKLVCNLAGGPQLRRPIDPSLGVWWVGYCSGFTLSKKPGAFEVTFQEDDSGLTLNFGAQTIGPFQRSPG